MLGFISPPAQLGVADAPPSAATRRTSRRKRCPRLRCRARRRRSWPPASPGCELWQSGYPTQTHAGASKVSTLWIGNLQFWMDKITRTTSTIASRAPSRYFPLVLSSVRLHPSLPMFRCLISCKRPVIAYGNEAMEASSHCLMKKRGERKMVTSRRRVDVGTIISSVEFFY